MVDKDVWILGGKKVNNIHELSKVLEGMSPRTFSKHHKRNDFHDFIKDTHNDNKLAVQLLNVSGRDDALALIQKRIAQMEKPTRKLNKNANTTKKMKVNKTKNNLKLAVPLAPSTFWDIQRKREAIIGGVTIILLLGVLGLSVKSQITAAIVGGPLVLSEIHFLSLGSIAAILVLLAIAIFVLKRHAKNSEVVDNNVEE